MKIKKSNLVVVLFMLMSFSSVFFIACDKDPETTTPETGTLTDIDGNVYNTVKIGNTWWMAENLKTQKYRNGDIIDSVSTNEPDTLWRNKKTGAYCYLDPKFGFLYNFYTITDGREIAPEGWHIPSDEEWKELEIYLGMTIEASDSINWRGSDQGNKLKINGGSSNSWEKSSDIFEIFGTNESGFTALGGACRIFDGNWGYPTHTAFWWTSTINENDAWYRGLDYNKTNVFRYSGPMNYGFSIRCVKD